VGDSTISKVLATNTCQSIQTLKNELTYLVREDSLADTPVKHMNVHYCRINDDLSLLREILMTKDLTTGVASETKFKANPQSHLI